MTSKIARLDFSPDQRRTLRPRARRRPIIGSLRVARPAASDSTTQAQIRRGGALPHNQWEPLVYYLDDGRLPIDNSAVERDLRALTIGRNNWLFIGSPQAGPRAAVLYTLVASAARHDLDVWAYLCDVLQRLAVLRQRLDGSPLPPELLTPLLPDVWAEAHPEAIRSYRQHERESRAAAKRVRREKRRAQARASRNPPG